MALGTPKLAAAPIDHIGCGTKSVTHVDTSIQNANCPGVAVCPRSDATALTAH